LEFTRENLLLLLTLIPILLLSMTLHELAHGVVALKLGDPTAKRSGRLSLNPIKHLDPLGTAMFFITFLLGGVVFGWAKPVPVSPYYFKNRQRGMALVGLAGPLTNFAVAIAFVLALNALRFKVDSFAFLLFLLVFQVNIILGIFNFIPVPPLDGSRVVGAFLPKEAYEKWVALDRYGMVLVIVVLIVLFSSKILGRVVWGLTDLFLSNYR
jgi:Zn-dependent protease